VRAKQYRTSGITHALNIYELLHFPMYTHARTQAFCAPTNFLFKTQEVGEKKKMTSAAAAGKEAGMKFISFNSIN
jgi:hypothetical protein